MVCVLPWIFPANVMVAPNSPRLLAKTNTKPLIIPGEARGRLILKKVLSRDAPRVMEAFSYTGSINSKEALMVLTASGVDTTTDAMTSAAKLKDKRICRISASHFPMNPLLPKNKSSRYPVTTGGATRGRAMNPSMTFFPGNDFLAKTQAMPVETGMATTVLKSATLTVSQITFTSYALNVSILYFRIVVIINYNCIIYLLFWDMNELS